MIFTSPATPLWTTCLDFFSRSWLNIYFTNSFSIHAVKKAENEEGAVVKTDEHPPNNKTENKKRKKRKRIVTRARKVIPGLS